MKKSTKITGYVFIGLIFAATAVAECIYLKKKK